MEIENICRVFGFGFSDNECNPKWSTRVASNAAGGSTFSLASGDLDGDGDIDLVSASGADNAITFYRYNALNNYTAVVITTARLAPRAVAVADIDADGDLDIVAAFSGAGIVSWFQNSGSGTFTERVITTLADAAGVAVGDFNRDGTIDVAASSRDTNTIIVFFQTPGLTPPAFTSLVLSTTALGAFSLHAVDLDRDGDVDLLSAHRDDDRIVWWRSNGAGAFAEVVISATVNGARSVAAADMDRDGDLDIVAAATDDNTIYWFENKNFVFSANVVSAASSGVFAIALGDVDGDCDIDILAAERTSNLLNWYENDGLLTGSLKFTSKVISNLATNIRAVMVVDMDRDGDLDVVSGNDVPRYVTTHSADCCEL